MKINYCYQCEVNLTKLLLNYLLCINCLITESITFLNYKPIENKNLKKFCPTRNGRSSIKRCWNYEIFCNCDCELNVVN